MSAVPDDWHQGWIAINEGLSELAWGEHQVFDRLGAVRDIALLERIKDCLQTHWCLQKLSIEYCPKPLPPSEEALLQLAGIDVSRAKKVASDITGKQGFSVVRLDCNYG